MKKKIQTDGVQELFEIVRAIQNGEEPEEAVQKKREERAEVQRQEILRQEEAAREEKQRREEEARLEKQRRQEEAQKRRENRRKTREERAHGAGSPNLREKDGVQQIDELEEDDFDKASEADTQKNSASSTAVEWFSKGAQKIAGAFRSISNGRKKPEAAEESETAVEDDAGKEAEADTWEKTVSGAARAAENTGGEIEEDSAKLQDHVNATEAPEASEPAAEGEPEGIEKDTEQLLAVVEHTVQDKARSVSEEERDSQGAASADDDSQHKGWILEEDMAAAVAANRRAPLEEETEDSEKEPEESRDDTEAVKTERKKLELPHFSLQGVQDYAREMKTNLEQRGFGKKEGGMLAAGLVLAVLILALIVNAITASVEQKKKMEHVTADKGLVVTVEKEPQEWSRSYPVVLGVRVKGDRLETVEINGRDYKVDEKGMVVVETSDYLLELVAKKDKETLKAQIEIPKLDAQKPVVNVAREEDVITAAGADNRSGIARIWYAAVHKSDFTQIPLYQKYSKPLAFEEDTTYYFYAQDKAGNSSASMITTMAAPESISFGQAQLSLFPGETSYLELQVEPERALLNNLKYESANPEIAAVDGNGMVTAVGEGSTIIHVSADGVEEIACPVTVGSTRTVTISAVGDCTLGSDASFNTSTNFDAFAAVNGNFYFFANVKDILENDDATFANLEGTLTTADARENKQYAFKGDPSYTEVLEEGSIDVVTLANNHSSDYGAQSHSDTKSYLTEAGIDYCTGDEIAIKDVNGIRTAFIGIYVLDEGLAKEAQVKETISAAKEQGAQLVIVAFHWGTEKATEPDATQTTLAHAAVDAGADLVVGHHPHVLQGIEKYNGKYIAYSLGNFCFGGNSAPSDMDTIIFRQTFTVTKDGVGADAEVEIIPCSISSVDGYNNYQPTPAQGEQADRIMERLNEYSSAYGQTFEASAGVAEGVETQRESADAV